MNDKALFCDGNRAQPHDPDDVTGVCKRCHQGTYAHFPLHDANRTMSEQLANYSLIAQGFSGTISIEDVRRYIESLQAENDRNRREDYPGQLLTLEERLKEAEAENEKLVGVIRRFLVEEARYNSGIAPSNQDFTAARKALEEASRE